MARTPLAQRLDELKLHPKCAFLQELNRVVYVYLDGPPKRTLAAIAQTMNYSSAALTKWLTGTNPIGRDECHRLCTVIGLDAQQLVGVLELGRFDPGVVVHLTRFISEEDLFRQHEADQAAQRQRLDAGQRVRLQTLIAPDSRRLFDDHRTGFVGRATELATIHQKIAVLRATGGYVVIRSQAGEGKSSLIARLIEEYDEATTTYYFISFSPSADEQIRLLQSVLAQLIRKHQLLDQVEQYLPVNAQLPTLCNALQYLLDYLHDQGAQEVIFIDGLDQIKPDLRLGERDLSFLPLELPPGIVIVVGTRPDDTLKPLGVRAPLESYSLPPLSLDDFAVLLRTRQAVLAPAQCTALYELLYGNAFDLDFVARLVATTPGAELDILLTAVKRNPRNLFGITLDRLKRDADWQPAIKPVLGCLLATVNSQPLTEYEIGAVTGLAADQVSEALLKLGGLVKAADRDGRAIYYLYHLKLIDYLQDEMLLPGQKIFRPDEIAEWHAHLADWCARGETRLAGIWHNASHDSAMEARRAYAQLHYISHVFYAQDTERLQTILDFDMDSVVDEPSIADVLYTLRILTADDPARGEQLILEHVLPIVTYDSDPDQDIHYALARGRDELLIWMKQYPADSQASIRDHLLDALLVQLHAAPRRSVCWMLSRIGFRRDDVVQALWDVVDAHNDELGDTGLATLTALGVPMEAHVRLLAMLHARAIQRRSTPLTTAMRRLADPESLDVLQQSWLQIEQLKSPDVDLSYLVGLPADIADAHDDALIADRAWQLLADLIAQAPNVILPAIQLGGKIAPWCDSPDVIGEMFHSLQSGSTPESSHARYLIYLRLAECVRPRQLTGWKDASDPNALAFIREDACQDTHATSRWKNEKLLVKQAAWDTLLRLGYAEALTWFEDGVAAETNKYVAQQIVKLLSVFRFDPLPMTVRRWITEIYDGTQDTTGEFVARIAAIQIARSAATHEAFDVLLHFGLTTRGQALKNSADALSDVALWLARAGDITISDRLMTMVIHGEHLQQRAVAAEALSHLATAGLMPESRAPDLLTLLADEGRDQFELSFLVDALSALAGVPFSPATQHQLRVWARERDDWLGGSALEALVRRGLAIDDPDLLERLGLQHLGDIWDLAPGRLSVDWSPRLIGLLYRQRSDQFTLAVVSLIVTADWEAAVQLMTVLRESARALDQLPAIAIQQALIARALRRQQRTYAEPELFPALAELAPAALVHADWPTRWHRWRPETRAVLADALGQLRDPDLYDQQRAIQLLLMLADDNQYGVRRAAFRALARHSPDVLHQQCLDWAAAPVVVGRERAAEGCSWLANDAIFDQLVRALLVDVEPTVRAAAEVAREARRERQWATDYLAHVRTMYGDQGVEVLSVWRYGAALAYVGDDAVAEALRDDLTTGDLPPHVRYWLQQIIDGIEQRWRKVTKQWPEPWQPGKGAVEEGDGTLVYSGGRPMAVSYILWREPAPAPGSLHSWGGVLILDESIVGRLGHATCTLHLTGEREATISVVSSSGSEVEFLGVGAWPPGVLA